MLYEQLIIGFDAREMWLPYSTNWPQERRDAFLLRQDLEKPLSTDRSVWPSVFQSDADLEIPLQHRSRDNLWKELKEMQTYLKDKWGSRWKSSWVIAITELMKSQDKQKLQPDYPFKPVEVDGNWRLLGYDVSDGNLWSALSGARYESNEIQSLKERWAVHLNEYHLFTEQEQADNFADWADDRDKGRAPYYIFGLYMIQQLGEE